MPESNPREVVETYLRAVLNREGPETVDELIASDTFRVKIGAFRTAFPDLVVIPRVVIADGNFVAVHASGRGTHLGIFQGVPPTGRNWTASCTALYRVEHGKIADFWVNWDLLAILEQLGAVSRASFASA